MGRCLRCAKEQREEGREEKDIEWQSYQGETSRSVVSRAREHYSDYKTALKKPPPAAPAAPAVAAQGGMDWRGGAGQQEDKDEEGTSWMADHTRSQHGGAISKDPREDYDFVVLGQYRKPLQRQIEEVVCIKRVMQQGFLMLGQGP